MYQAYQITRESDGSPMELKLKEQEAESFAELWNHHIGEASPVNVVRVEQVDVWPREPAHR